MKTARIKSIVPSRWRRGLHLRRLHLSSPGWRFRRRREPCVKKVATSTATHSSVMSRFLARPPAPRIRPPVIARFFTTLRAAITRLAVQVPSLATLPVATTRRSGLVRFHATRLRTATRPQEVSRSGSTRPATGTRPLALLRSIGTQPVTATRALVSKHSSEAGLDQITSHWASMPA